MKNVLCNATSLLLGSATMTSAQLMVAIPALQQMTNLTTLSFNGAALVDDAAVAALVPVITRQTQLGNLDFARTQLSDVGVNTLIPVLSLPQLINIYRLNFRATKITDTGALALLPTMQQMPKLVVLFMPNALNATTKTTLAAALPAIVPIQYG